MSRRPSSWFAATGLLALAAAATPAQPPPTVTRDGGTEPFRAVVSPSQVADAQSNPWRGVTAGPKPNPWRGTPVGSVSAPWAKDKWVDVEFRPAPVTGPTAGGCPACAGARSPVASGTVVSAPTEAPAPRPACCQDQPTVVEGIGAFAPVPSRPAFGAAPQQHARGNLVVVAAPVTLAVARLSGTWCREMPGMMTALAFTGDEMKVTLVLNSDGTIATVTLTADYAVTKDGTVHGVVTGADVEISGKTDVAGLDLASLSLELQTYTDQPFAFRCRPTDGGLMVSNVRLGGGRVMPVDALPPAMMLGGKYRPAGGPLPTPKPTKLTPAVASACEGPSYPGGAVLMPPPGPPVFVPPPPPAYAPAPVIAAPLPVCPAPVGTCPASPAAGPAPFRTVPPPEVLETMTRVFGEMANGPVPVPAYPTAPFPTMPPQVCLPPVPAVCNGAYPVTGVTPTAYIPPPPPTSTVPAARPGQMPVGTWCREVGPLTYTVDVKDGHLTLTLAMTTEEDGATVTVQSLLTADAYLTRTDGGIVGLITGVDATVTGKNVSPSDAKSLLEKLPDMQKALADKPFALSFRMYDDALVIGNVRLPSPKDSEDEMRVWASMAGRYKRSTGPLPKGKPMKVEAVSGITLPIGGMTLPSPRYLEHYPEYFPPDPSFPLPRELAQQAPDLPAATNAARGPSDVPVPPMNRPVALPEPVRPVELRETSPAPRRAPGQAQEVKQIPAARN